MSTVENTKARNPKLPNAEPLYVPQLLMVYNPSLRPGAVREHVARLEKKGFVWWGRFSGDGTRPDEAQARARWQHVAALADERAVHKKPLLVFITDYVSLHVLKVTDVVFGDHPASRPRLQALGYYAPHAVPLWFRVTDLRALSHEAEGTRSFFAQQLGRVRAGATTRNGRAYDRRYDPHAAVVYEHPIVVDAPAVAKVFEQERPPQGERLWALAPDAVIHRPVQQARADVEKALSSDLWRRLTPDSQNFLANGWVEKGRMERDHDIDPAMGFTRIANALERELCDELMIALRSLSERLRNVSQLGRILEEELHDSATRDSYGRPVHWSMGSSLDLLRRLADFRKRRHLNDLGMESLKALCIHPEGIEDIKRLRDPAAHGRAGVSPATLRSAVREFYADGAKPLALVVKARCEVMKTRELPKAQPPTSS